MNFILLIILLSLAEFVGDANLKLYSRNKKIRNILFAIFGYIFVFKFLIEALKQKDLIITNGTWNAIQTIVETALAYWLLHERLTSWKQWAGLLLIVSGIFFLNYSN